MISDEEILSDVLSVAEKLDDIPTRREYDERGSYSHITVRRRFGSWNRCVLSLFGDVNNRQNIPKDDLIEEIRRLSEKLDRPPMQEDMKSEGIYNPETYHNKFSSWKSAVKEAGFDPITRGLKSGSDHRDWKGGTTDYYHPNWDEIRQEVLDRDEHKCTLCGESDSRLSVHHIRPRSEFIDNGEYDYESACERSNLVTVCTPCHMKFEGVYVGYDYERFIEEASKDLSNEEKNT